MPLTYVTLRLDAATDRAVRAMWAIIDALGLEARGRSGFRPHVTIAAYDLPEPETARAVVDSAVRGIERCPVDFQAVGIFPDRGVVFLAPRPTDALLQIHAATVAAFAAAGHPEPAFEHLLHGHWMPHCTLAAGLSARSLARAIEASVATWSPIDGQAEAVGLRVPPATSDHCERQL